MTALRRGISYQLRQDLVPVRDEPRDMTSWVRLCLELEGRRKAMRPLWFWRITVATNTHRVSNRHPSY